MEQAEHIAVSVIIPIFNAERHMEECLDSCFGQTLTNIEIICINDGSTDKTEEILERYAQGHNNMRVLSQENQGAGAARNLGMKYAKGEFIAFMDSDDYYPSKEVLQKLYHQALSENVFVCGGSALFLKDKGIDAEQLDFYFQTNKKICYKDFQKEGGFTCFIYNRKFMESHELLFPEYRYFEDPPFFVRTMAAAKIFCVISDYVYAIRNTDKILRYDNKNIIINALDGICDILEIARKEKYYMLRDNMRIALRGYLPFIYKAIYRGNEDIRKRYDRVLLIYEECFTENTDHLEEENFKLLSNDEINQMVITSLKREKKFMKRIKKFSQILIYGAGRGGRWLYDYIMQRGYNGNVEFMVSSKEVKDEACGKKVKSICECARYKDDALVLIANKNSADQMEENAHKHLFKNVEKIPYEELMLFGADLKEDNYITIF